MTGLLHEKEFSRKAFLAGGGALVVSMTAVGSAVAATGATPFAARTSADYQTASDARQSQVDTWLSITADNKIIVTHGEVEFSGSPTGILMIVAEELNMTDLSQMVYAHPESWLNSVGGSFGSNGISTQSRPARAAAAYAMGILNTMASTQLGVPVTSLTASNGVITGGGKSVKYSDLIGGKLFNYTMPSGTTTPTPGVGTAPLVVKPVSAYGIAGTLKQRIDIPAKVAGTYTYIHNVRVPGMIHGRRVRPRGAGANASQNHYPLSVDQSSIAGIPGAQVIQVNNWLGVVAPKEYDAIQAAAQLKVVWKNDPKFGDGGSGNYWKWLRIAGDTGEQSPARYTADTSVNGVNTVSALATAAHKVTATYRYHYNNYVPIGPHCAVADIRKDSSGNITGTVYAQGQNISSQSGAVAGVLSTLSKTTVSAANIRAIWYEGSGSYGGGQSGQAVEEAAILSYETGKPVRLQWMRWDQTGWDSYGPSNLWDVTAGVDASGNIVGMDWNTYGQAGTTIDNTLELIGTATWPATPGTGGASPSDNSVYNKGTWPHRVLAKTQPLYNGALKSSALRAPGAPQSYFASEQIADELAYAAKMDPIAFRRQNIDGTQITGARWLAVMDGATLAAGWQPRVAFSGPTQTGDVRTGRGFGFGTFASSQTAIVAEVEVNIKTGRLIAKHLTVAQNNGITISLEGVTSQMSGAMIQGLSRCMWEQPTWTKDRITSVDWVTYPILRFKDAPTVTLVNVHPGQYLTVTPGDTTATVQAGNTAAYNEGWTLTGSGEPPTTAIGSAMANAFFDATGARVRQTPMLPSTIRGALKAAGVV